MAAGRAWRWVGVVGVAGPACALLDRQHVASGAISYHGGEQPWWVPLQFMVATVAMVSAVEPVRRLLRGSLPATASASIPADAVAFAGAWLATCHLQDRPGATLALLLAWWLSRVLTRPAFTIPFALACAAAGLAVEAAVIAAGVFTYARPELLGVARWLPAIYLHAALLATSLSAWIRDAPPLPQAADQPAVRT